MNIKNFESIKKLFQVRKNGEKNITNNGIEIKNPYYFAAMTPTGIYFNFFKSKNRIFLYWTTGEGNLEIIPYIGNRFLEALDK
jgi:poly-D-alanine transfer protein DltD